MTPTGGSWVTKPKYQAIAGIAIIVCILAGFLGALAQVQSERDQRQADFEEETFNRDIEIENGQVDIACAFIRGLEQAFKPGSLEGVTDEATRQRIIANNNQRSQALAAVRGQMPTKIAAQITTECPPEPG